MKKALFIALVAVASLASCKKDYTCTCKTTLNGTSTGDPSITTIVGVSKSTAKANCASFETSETTVLGTFTFVGTCELK